MENSTSIPVILIFVSLVVIPSLVIGETALRDKPHFFKAPEELIKDKGVVYKNIQRVNKTFSGYIVEFKKEPVLKKKQKLEKNINEREERLEKSHPIYKYTLGIIDRMGIQQAKSNLKQRISSYKKEIEREHKSFKDKLFEKTVTPTGRIIGARKRKKIIGEFKTVFNGIAFNISSEKAERIEKMEEVEEVHPNYILKPTLTDSVPQINADEVWKLKDSKGRFVTGKDIKIGIIDTGVDYTHPDLGGCTQSEFLSGNCEKVVDGYDFPNSEKDPMDSVGHGTHVASIAAGKADYNGNGECDKGEICGVAPAAKIVAYDVFQPSIFGEIAYSSTVIKAIERGMDPNQDGNYSDRLDIISMSLGGPGNPEDSVSKAVDNAVESGVVAVTSAGNSGPGGRSICRGGEYPSGEKDSICSPGTSKKAITIGAVDKSDKIAGFSSRGPVIWENGSIIKPDIVAPGVNICAAQWDDAFSSHGNPNCNNDDTHVAISGTSMAAPHISGVVALIFQKHPSWSPEEVKMALRNNAIDLGKDIIDQGWGRVDALKSVDLGSAPPVSNIKTSGKIRGAKIKILGTAKSENFVNYTLYYTKGWSISKKQWSEICSSLNQMRDGILCEWKIRDLNDGKYALKLVTRDQDQQSTVYGFVNIKNTEITSPVDLKTCGPQDLCKVIPSWKKILINGTSAGYKFDHYRLEWCLEGKKCSSENITLTNNGLKPVKEDVLGIWSASSFKESDFYTINLTTYYSGGRRAEDTNKMYLETDLQKGWPVSRKIIGSTGSGLFLALSFLNQPTIADINNDGGKDLVMAYGRSIDVIKHNGEDIEGWPVKIKTSCGFFNASMQEGPAVADLDKDGFNEIVIGDSCGYFHVLNHDGSYVKGWPKQMGNSNHQTPMIADVNNDNNLEIVVGDWDGYLRVFNLKGNYLSGWPRYLPRSNILEAASIGDLDNSPQKEIVITSIDCTPTCINTSTKIWALKHNGTVIQNWPKYLKREARGSAILADIDKDNQTEIISGSYEGLIYAWNPDGSNVTGWPVDTGGNRLEQPAVGDIDDDESLELVITGNKKWKAGCLFAYESNGKNISNFPICKEYGYIDSAFSGTPVIANIDNDKENEIITSSSGGHRFKEEGYLAKFYAINHDASIVEGFPKMLDYFPLGNVAPVGDLDNDGDIELVVKTWTGYIFVWDLPRKVGKEEWPMYQHDPQHTGFYPVNISTTSTTTSTTSTIITKKCYDSDAGKNYLVRGTCGTKYNISKVSSGGYHTCALLNNSNVKCWGDDTLGQADDYLNNDAVAISAGTWHTCALLNNSNVKCWGDNNYGQSNNYSNGDAIGVSAGGGHTCVLLKNGNINCWGDDTDGQASDYKGRNGIAVTAGYYHTCALLNNGNIDCWGRNTDGQAVNYKDGNAIWVSAGAYHTCALLNNGNIDCWGAEINNKSQAIDYTNGDAKAVTTGKSHTCALLTNSNIDCWGLNDEGQGSDYTNGGAVAVSGGMYHTCALLTDKIHCWGLNNAGQSSPPNETTKIDHCSGNKILVEFYCDKIGYCKKEKHQCPYGCEDGACVGTTTTTSSTTTTTTIPSCNAAKCDWDCCSRYGPCEKGEGDCDSDEECKSGLVCLPDIGKQYGCSERLDVCSPEKLVKTISIEKCYSKGGITNDKVYVKNTGHKGISSKELSAYVNNKQVSMDCEDCPISPSETVILTSFSVDILQGDKVKVISPGNIDVIECGGVTTTSTSSTTTSTSSTTSSTSSTTTTTSTTSSTSSSTTSSTTSTSTTITTTSSSSTTTTIPSCNATKCIWECCVDYGPCEEGEGDCNTDKDCEGELICKENIGKQYGCSWSFDVCKSNITTTTTSSSTTTSVSSSTSTTSLTTSTSTTSTTISDCEANKCIWGCCSKSNPCEEDEGDCNTDEECKEDLICKEDVGNQYGCPSSFDVCKSKGTTTTSSTTTTSTSSTTTTINQRDCYRVVKGKNCKSDEKYGGKGKCIEWFLGFCTKREHYCVKDFPSCKLKKRCGKCKAREKELGRGECCDSFVFCLKNYKYCLSV